MFQRFLLIPVCYSAKWVSITFFNSLENEGKKKIEQRVRFEVDKLKVKPEFEGPILRSTRLKILRDEFLNK